MYNSYWYIIEVLLGSTGAVLTLALGLFCILAYRNLVIKVYSKHTYVGWFGVALLFTGLWATFEVWNEQNIFRGYDLAITYGMGTTLPLAFYFFVQSLGGKIKFNWKTIVFSVIQIFIIFYILHPKYGVVSYENGISTLRLGSLAHLIFVLYMLSTSFIVLSMLFKLMKSSKESYIKSIFFAIIIPFTIVTVSNIIIPFIFLDNSYHRIGPLGLLIMAVYITYIIIRQEALKIPIILFQIYALVTILIVVILIQVGLMLFGIVNIFSPERLVLIIILSMIVAILIKQTIAGVEEEASLETLYRKLKNIVKSKNQFIQISSHQLRTPITAIKGYLSLLQESHSYKNDEIGLYTMQMTAIIQNMSTIIEDVLNVNELNTGKFGVNLKNIFNVKTQLESILDNKIFLFNKYNIQYQYKYKGNQFTIIGDEVKLKEVLNNAIDNALQYGKSKTKVNLFSMDNQIKIEVIDDGIGIAKEEQKLLFKAYQRGKYAKQMRRDGTGLGLHLMKLIVEAHNGSVDLSSKGRNKGSKLTIILPRRTTIE